MSIAADPLIGTEFLGYRIEELIGRGGMGVVYRAYDLRLKRNVALKLVAPELSQDERFRERFLAESELAASLDHPNVIPIYNAGEHDDQLDLAMRYVEGSDLKRLLKEEGTLPPERAIAICTQLADALDAAHARGLVHRDVKPSNVLLDSHEHVYLADFGLSRRLSEQAPGLEATLSLGTPAYVAPEQIEGDDVDGKADVYSLGCLLYECLTGEAPFARDSELAVLWAHLNDPPPAPPGLEQVMAKALAKDPQERYATCGELMEGAREALGLTRGRDRRPLALAALGVLVAAGALVTGLVLVFGNGGQGPAKPDLTVRNNSLVRLDPETNKIASVTKVGRGPRAMAVAGQTVWVYNTDDGTVSAIDARTGTVKRTARISASAPSGGNGPLIAADASGAWIVGTSGGKGVLTKVRLGLTYQPEFWLDYDPVAIALGEGAVWVAANGVRGNAVLRISPSTGAVLAKVPFRAGIDANLAGIAVGEGAVWVTNVAGTLFRIDPATPLITGKVNVGLYPAAPAVGYGAAWVTTYEPRPRLVRVDPRTMRVTQTIPAPGIDSYDLAFVDGSVWWNGWRAGTVWRFDPRTGKIASTIRLTPPRPEGVAALFHPWTIATGASSVWVTMSTEVSVG